MMLPFRGGALADLIRDGIALAHSLTDTLQSSIELHQWVGSDANGKERYATPPLTLSAVVDHESSVVKTADGQDVKAATYVLILQLVPSAVEVDSDNPRRNPVDERDKIILPDGSTGPILKVKGFVDSETNLRFYSEIWLG
jgi:hypothetical protein